MAQHGRDVNANQTKRGSGRPFSLEKLPIFSPLPHPVAKESVMPSVSVPRQFFTSERSSAYADWQAAFWRELLSNSIDAGASQVAIRTRFDEAGGFVIDMVDNGKGMDRATVENVYMSLGASTKRDEAGIGGFGRARILTCFSQRSYRIRTSNLVVTGEGGEYEVRETPAAVKGCAVTIATDPQAAYLLTRALTRVLRQSSLPVAVRTTLATEAPEGRRILSEEDARNYDAEGRFRNWARKGAHLRTLSDESGTWGEVWVSKGEKALHQQCIVRVGGMAMYEDHISARAQVTVELTPARARQILTSARDSIRSPWRDELQKLFAEIASEARSALRTRSQPPQTLLVPSGAIVRGLAIPKPSLDSAPAPAAFATPTEDLGRTDRSKVGSNAYEATTEAEGLVTLSEDDGESADPMIAELQRMRRRLPRARLDVGLHIDNPAPAQRASIRRYLPETWTLPGGEGRNAELLHAAWTGACRQALETLVRLRPTAFGHGEAWVTGFVFDTALEACHMPMGDIPHGLLLNPVDREGRAKFKLSESASLRKLGALALHEVAHCLHGWHDESFANALTDLFAETRERDMEKAIRSEMEEARSWISRREAAWAAVNARMVDMGLGTEAGMADLQARVDAEAAARAADEPGF
jgi:hypothetical protein